jgi:Phage integrase, N-terminal SAM-like domain
MTRRSPWGSVRRLPSGRFQARYRVDAVEHLAPQTFSTARQAHAFLATTRTAIERGAWIDVDAATVPLADYATRWLHERALLRPRTSELYEGLLRIHILPTLGPVTLADLKPPMIRTWHAGLLSGPRPGATTAAKSYRLLRTILATAVDDDVLEKNPCRIRGAGVEHSKERPIATIEQVYALADAIDPMYRVLVLTATFTSLASVSCARSRASISTCSTRPCTSPASSRSSKTAASCSLRPRPQPASARSRSPPP